MQILRKVIVISVIFVTVLSMSAVVAPAANAAAAAGDLIKMNGLSSVYYLGADGKRYVFPNEQTYFSWYGDFSSVMTIPQSELESYPLGANVTIRPGTKLVKITTNPKVYAVTGSGNLLAVPSESVASTLFGANWAKRIVDVPDAFFTNYKIATGEVSAAAYPAGSLIKSSTGADVYYIASDGKAQKIASEAAFNANRFKWADVIVTTLAIPALGVDISGKVSSLVDTSSGAGGTIGAGTGLTVALASDTPASVTIITNTTATTGNGQALVPFTKLNFTASSDGDVKVTNLKFKRTGISADTDVDSLYLYDGAARLTDSATISSNIVTFNNSSGLFTVTAGQTRSITLKGDMNYAASSGKSLGFSVEAAASVTTNGASVSGSFPASGNLMSTANVTDLGRMSVTVSAIPSAVDTAIDPDTTNQEVFKATLQGYNQELKVDRMVFTEIGSIQKDDVANFVLFTGGTKLGEVAAMNADNEVVIDMSAAPLTIAKGSSKVVSLRADVVKGSTRTFKFTIQRAADLAVKDTNYGVYVEPYAAGTFAVLTPGTVNFLISSGALSVAKSTDCPTGNVVLDGTNVSLGKWDFRASGENIKVQDLNAKATVSTYGGILNGKLFVDGVQVGSTKNLTQATNVNFTFGSTFVVNAGKTAKVEVIGDIKTTTSTSFAGSETVTANIGTVNYQRMASLGTTSTTGSDANALNITAAALSINKYSGYGNQTIVAGTGNAKLASFSVGAGSAQGVDVSSITVALSQAESATVTNMVLKDHATGAQLGDTKVSPSTNNTFSVSFSLAKSGSKVIDLYADVKSASNAGPWIANVASDGSGQVTGSAVNASGQDLQTITIGNGNLFVNAGSNPDSDVLIAGSLNNKVAQYTFSASNESYTISELLILTENNFATTTAVVRLKYGSTVAEQGFVTAATDALGVATFTGLSIVVPKDGSINVDVELDTVLLSQSGASGATGSVYLDKDTSFKATGEAGDTKLTVGTGNLSGNAFYVRKTKPTFARQALSGSPAAGTIFKFTVVADAAGNVELKQLGFNVATTGVSVSGLKLYDSSTGSALTTTAVDVDGSGNVKLPFGSANDTVGVIGTTAKTYEVRGTVAGWGSGDSITSTFKQDAAASLTTTAATIMASDYNVWSDKSVVNHSTTSADWTNGFLLKTMTDAQTFSG